MSPPSSALDQRTPPPPSGVSDFNLFLGSPSKCNHPQSYVDFFFVLFCFPLILQMIKRKRLSEQIFSFFVFGNFCVNVTFLQRNGKKEPLKSLIMNKGMYLIHGCIESLSPVLLRDPGKLHSTMYNSSFREFVFFWNACFFYAQL